MIVFYIFAAPGALVLLGCCLVFWLKKTHGFWAYFLLGWTLLILLSLPAGIWQGLFGWAGLSYSPGWEEVWERLSVPLIGWPINAAGFSMRFIFEVLGKELWGREGPVLEYFLLMALQTSIVAPIFAARYKRKKTFIDWGIICLGLLFLINSLANVNWYWGVG
jgi:hypothetical protein